MRWLIRGLLAALPAIALAGASHLPAATEDPAAISLSAQCPPSFVPRDGLCRLRTSYLQYDSLAGAGVGGLKTGLPAYRDGFTALEIDLGRYLFFDPLLSGDRTIACASCHDPDQGFSDGLARSRGVNGVTLSRNAPTLWNVGLLNRFFWDGRVRTLEEQMQGPLYDAHEMGNTPDALLRSLRANATYRRLFAQAWGESAQPITLPRIYRALVAFEASLISLNSRYDLYAQGFHEALTAREIAGMNVFRSFVARCAECHTPPLFTNQQLAVLGTPEPPGLAFDIGAQKQTHEASLRGAFKVPTLRNIALSAPYNHSGRFAGLRETVRFYTLGRGHAVPAGEKLTLHWHIWEPKLSETELDRLVDFLHTLTDESFKPARPANLPSGLPHPVAPSGAATRTPH